MEYRSQTRVLLWLLGAILWGAFEAYQMSEIVNLNETIAAQQDALEAAALREEQFDEILVRGNELHRQANELHRENLEILRLADQRFIRLERRLGLAR